MDAQPDEQSHRDYAENELYIVKLVYLGIWQDTNGIPKTMWVDLQSIIPVSQTYLRPELLPLPQHGSQEGISLHPPRRPL